jgi:hypothetical protein
VQSIGGEHHPAQSQLTDHLLGGGDFVRLVVDFRVRKDDRRSRGEGRQRLRRLAVVDVVEAAAQRLTVERDHRLFSRRQQGLGVAPERLFEVLGVQGLEHRPQRVHHRSPFQIHPEVSIEEHPALLQEGDDAAVGLRPAQQRQHREHQKMRQRIALALRSPRVRYVR